MTYDEELAKLEHEMDRYTASETRQRVQEAKMLRMAQMYGAHTHGTTGHAQTASVVPAPERTTRFWEMVLKAIDDGRHNRLMDGEVQRKEFEAFEELAQKRLADIVLEKITRESNQHDHADGNRSHQRSSVCQQRHLRRGCPLQPLRFGDRFRARHGGLNGGEHLRGRHLGDQRHFVRQ